MTEVITRKEARARGLKRYYTGEPCKWGHVSERYVRNHWCTECHHEYQREYRRERYRTDPEWAEREREYQRERYRSNPLVQIREMERQRRLRFQQREAARNA
jgi:hypothetical protein